MMKSQLQTPEHAIMPAGPEDRKVRREEFMSTYFGGQDGGWGLNAMPGDASFRKYYRVWGGERPMILMEDPPDRPPMPPYVMVRPFMMIADHLRRLGLNAPQIHARNLDHGLLLLDDFGENTYTKLLNTGENAKPLYELAMDVLIHLHNHPDRCGVEVDDYDTDTFIKETLLFIDWSLPMMTGRAITDDAREEWVEAWREILAKLPTDQNTLVLRDYHVDNLMLVDGEVGLNKCGLLDFQDGLIGPMAYDVMSLLEDARRTMDENLYDYLLYDKYLTSVRGLDKQSFLKSFYILAAQRHAKVLGIFVRLFKRDEKPRYLSFLPHVHQLFHKALVHQELAPLNEWFERHKIDISQVPDAAHIQGK